MTWLLFAIGALLAGGSTINVVFTSKATVAQDAIWTVGIVVGAAMMIAALWLRTPGCAA